MVSVNNFKPTVAEQVAIAKAIAKLRKARSKKSRRGARRKK